MLKVGLTGPLGSGKSRVADQLEDYGVEVIRADAIGHRLLEPGTDVYREVCRRYGNQVLHDDGRVNRNALAGVVFADPAELAAYNDLIHPALLATLRDELHQRESRDGMVVVDVALLYEWGIENLFDVIVRIMADRELRRERMVRNRGMSAESFVQRDRAQPGPRPDTRQPDITIQNNGEIDALQQQVAKLWQRLVHEHQGQ